MTDRSQLHPQHPAATLWHDLQAVMALVSQDSGGASQCAPALPIPTPPL
jgi:hypothetical protein